MLLTKIKNRIGGRLAAASLLCIVALVAASCKGGSTSTDTANSRTVTVVGELGAGYGVPMKAAGSLNALFTGTSGTFVDRIVAIPMQRGSLKAESMAARREAAVNTDGTFSLTLDRDRDWILALMDTTAPSTDRFVGSLAISTGASGSLLYIPMTSTTVSSMDLGTIELASSGSDGISTADTSVAFTMTSDQLTTLANTDALFKNAKNIINNYDTGTGVWYQLRPDFAWCGSYIGLFFPEGPPAYTFLGLNFQMDTNSTDVTMGEICSAGTVTLELVPPEPVSTGTRTYGPSSPLTNSGLTCEPYVVSGVTRTQTRGGDLYVSDAYGNLSYSVTPLFNSVPSGTWTWRENEATRAVYDLSSVAPPLTSNNGPAGFVPYFRVNLNNMDERLITSVTVSWKYYDAASGEYIEVTDLSILAHAIDSAEVKFETTYNNVRSTEEIYFDPVVTTRIVPSQAWYVMNNAHPDRSPRIMGFYESAGFGHFFHFIDPFSAGLTACGGKVFHPEQEIGSPFANTADVSGIRSFGIPNWSGSEPHNGIDLVVTRQTTTASRIIAPVDATVVSIGTDTNQFSNPPGNVIVTVKLYVNDRWSVALSLEPSSADPDVVASQLAAIRVTAGQEVQAGDDIADLIIGSDTESHVHLTVRRNETPVCAYAYAAADFKTDMDAIVADGTLNSVPDGQVCL